MASHVIHTALTFIEIAIEELSPDRMEGYGPVSETGAANARSSIDGAAAAPLHTAERSAGR